MRQDGRVDARPHGTVDTARAGDTEDMDNTVARIAGRVERLNETYGFIRGENGRDYFFLPKELRGGVEFGQLRKGQTVTFDPQEHERGLRAVNVEAGA